MASVGCRGITKLKVNTIEKGALGGLLLDPPTRQLHKENFTRKEVMINMGKKSGGKSGGKSKSSWGHPGSTKGLGKLPKSGVEKNSKNLFKH
jgi:hypothetical protein